MAAFVQETGAALRTLCPDLLPLVFGHLGDGNLHFNVGARAGLAAAIAFDREAAINDIVYGAVARCGGSVSAEHGLGQLRAQLAARLKSPEERAMMRAVKSALDPQGRMNPGKLV
jgi:FAD/FMN-containing dehydrogenase